MRPKKKQYKKGDKRNRKLGLLDCMVLSAAVGAIHKKRKPKKESE